MNLSFSGLTVPVVLVLFGLFLLVLWGFFDFDFFWVGLCGAISLAAGVLLWIFFGERN